MLWYKCKVRHAESAVREICYRLGAHHWEMAEVEEQCG